MMITVILFRPYGFKNICDTCPESFKNTMSALSSDQSYDTLIEAYPRHHPNGMEMITSMRDMNGNIEWGGMGDKKWQKNLYKNTIANTNARTIAHSIAHPIAHSIAHPIAHSIAHPIQYQNMEILEYADKKNKEMLGF